MGGGTSENSGIEGGKGIVRVDGGREEGEVV